MSEAQLEPEKLKRHRSPPYPAFSLEKAVERAALLFRKAQRHEVGAGILAEAWGMESTGGRVWRSAAALIQYGLLTDSGTGKARKFKLSERGLRLAQDNDPTSLKRREALKAAALTPSVHAELWGKFVAGDQLSDTVMKNDLTIDRAERGDAPYSASAADEVIQIYRATLAFAGLAEPAAISGETEDKVADKPDSCSLNQPPAKVGDFVKWTSGGVDQFISRKVEWIAADGSYLRVFGSPTGIPMSEIEIVESPAKPRVDQSVPHRPAAGASEIAVYQVGNRLQITADVDADGIGKLESVLAKYREILKLLS